eukprot:GFUD01011079.1.p1 GENE.GFUD01011079.1~~GFUD01011079.1.p1  ORF type:complete len:1280 (-),score=489.79 GFUD01011079.1:860-4699(-)
MAAAGSKRWYFSEEKLASSPSRRATITADKEESYRQQAANFIQDMGQRLQVTQLCINTAIVYMQRFYMFHSFSKFHRNSIAAAALFLAAKVEEQPRKLEHVIKVSHICLHRDQPHLDSKSEQYLEQAQELVSNENILLQTLGFDVAIDHPHTHVVKCCQLVKASKELAQTSYFMATNSLHLTTMCLRYPPTIVACVCIHLACKWSKYEIPLSGQGKPWYSYVDPTSNIEQIERLTKEFLTIFDKCPSRLKKKILQSHNDTKEEEDRRARENTQSNQYRLDFGDQKPPGPGVSSSRPGSSSSSGGQPGKPHPSGRPPSQPPTGGHKYPPGHPSASKAPPPGHSKPPGHPSAPPPGQHPKPAPPPGHHSSSSKSSAAPPPGYRPGQPKHGEKPPVPPPGHRSGSHSRSHSSGPPMTEEQQRAAKEQQQQRERRDHSQGREHSSRPEHKQPGTNPGPAAGYPPGYRTSSSSQPPPYPGQQPSRDLTKSSSSQPKPPSHPPKPARSIFDLSPEKTSRPEKPPPPIAPISDLAPPPPTSYHDTLPPYPGQGHAPPPSYQDPNTSLPNYPKPSVSAPFQPPLSLSPIRDTPSLSSLSRQPSLEPGEIMDTPTPTHISNMFNYPPKSGYSSKPAAPPAKAKDDNRSLQSILGFASAGPVKQEPAQPSSKLQQALFDPDFDLPASAMPLLPLPPVPSLPSQPVKAEPDFKPKTEPPSVSDFSDLFGDDSNSSNFMPNFRPFSSTSFKTGPVKTEPQVPTVKQEPRVKAEPSPTLQPSHTKLPSSPLKPPKREKDTSETKRKSADRPSSGSEEKKPRVSSRSGGLFSPSPERKPSVPIALPTLRSPLMMSPLTSPSGHGKRTRTASTSSNGEAMVNVQKLENIAPEFQAFKGTHGPASILVGPDGVPSPRKDRGEELLETGGSIASASNGSNTAVPHQPWTQPAAPPPAANTSTASSTVVNTTSPPKSVKKEGVSPAKSGHKRERGSSGETHSGSQGQDKKRSSSGHHRSDKHSSRPAGHTSSAPQNKDKPDPPPTLPSTDPVPPTPVLSESPPKQQQQVAVPPTEQTVGQEISPGKKEEEEKRKHKDKKDDKHKRKKEKKEKKEKKDKKDKKEKSEDGKKEDKDRKHKSKKKSKDRDKDKEKDHSKVSSGSLATPSQPKLKIKMATPTVSPGRAAEQDQSTSQATTPVGQASQKPAIPKIKLKLGAHSVTIQPDSNSHSSSKKEKEEKRKRSSSSVKLDKLEGPAAKMARAIGTDPSKEAKFLEESFKKKDDRKIVKPRLLPQTDSK